MNRLTRVLTLALATGSLLGTAYADKVAPAAAKALPGLSSPHEDIRQAAKDPRSLFNNPSASIQNSGVGGHIATLRTDSYEDGPTHVGTISKVQVEVTDPMKYTGAGGAAPRAILGNLSYTREQRGHDMDSSKPLSMDVKLSRTKTKGLAYRGGGVITVDERAGDDLDIRMGNKVGVSFAGKKGVWNSQYGSNYTVPVTTNH